MIAIGLKIKNIRIGLGLTVDFLSQALGVSRSYLTLIENEKRHIPKRLVGKLSKTLGLRKEIVQEWYLEQKLKEVGITNKKSFKLIKKILKMTSKEKESLLKILKVEKTPPRPPKK